MFFHTFVRIYKLNPHMNTQQQKKFNYWQWRTLIILMIGYILYYFVRKNFSAALPAMQEELGVTKLQLGIFITLNGIVYGFSRFVNGFIADRCSRRKLMAGGLALSALINFAICFSPLLISPTSRVRFSPLQAISCR